MARKRRLSIPVVTAVALVSALVAMAPARGSAAASAPSGGTNGVLEVSVRGGDGWHVVGSLPFNQFPATRTLALEDAAGVGGALRVRIAKVGGGAAHVDSALVDGRSADRVVGDDSGLLSSLLARPDRDLADVSEGVLELVYTGRDRHPTLALTARIEPVEVGGAPFEFPVENTFTPITSESSFYSYSMDPARDGSRLWTPVFAERSIPHSGHPEGTTYGWLRHDADTLYATVDFTSDNTMDGGADFVTLWVNGPAGPRPFTVTSVDTRWGRPEFKASAHAGYRHKLYRFAIPRRELGVTRGELELAFSAYGTAAVQLVATKDDALVVDADHNSRVTPGDTLRYTVVASAVSSIGPVTFTDTPDPATALVVGSVTTSQGTVTSGNTSGDTSVAVSVGTILSATPVTITFDVVITSTEVTQVVNQGSMTITDGPTFRTSDPAVGPGSGAPTVTAVQPPNIPTLSRWGLLGMSLLLLAAAMWGLAVLRR